MMTGKFVRRISAGFLLGVSIVAASIAAPKPTLSATTATTAAASQPTTSFADVKSLIAALPSDKKLPMLPAVPTDLQIKVAQRQVAEANEWFAANVAASRITVTGEVGEVSPMDSGEIRVTVDPGLGADFITSLTCVFKASDQAALLRVNRFDRVTLTGTVKKVEDNISTFPPDGKNYLTIEVGDCSLGKMKPDRR